MAKNNAGLHDARGSECFVENCESFCSDIFAKSHCNLCKCRACTFCQARLRAPLSAAQREKQAMLDQVVRRAWGRELNSTWCSRALMQSPTHLFHHMWAAASWAPMETGSPACWDVHREAPNRQLSPVHFFRETESGAHCSQNWYEGHVGSFGRAEHLPQFNSPAPALLGYDESIHQFCAAKIKNKASRAKSCSVELDGPGMLRHGPRCCNAANFNILNLLSQRVPCALLQPISHLPLGAHLRDNDLSCSSARTLKPLWGSIESCADNLCRNLEWQVCAVLGKLPGQRPGDRSIRFANAPLELDVEPISRASTWRGSGASARLIAQQRKCEPNVRSASTSGTASNGTLPQKPAFKLADIFHLEVCLFNQICTNGHLIFRLKVGEAFVCTFSHERFAALANVLLNFSHGSAAKCGH